MSYFRKLNLISVLITVIHSCLSFLASNYQQYSANNKILTGAQRVAQINISKFRLFEPRKIFSRHFLPHFIPSSSFHSCQYTLKAINEHFFYFSFYFLCFAKCTLLFVFCFLYHHYHHQPWREFSSSSSSSSSHSLSRRGVCGATT